MSFGNVIIPLLVFSAPLATLVWFALRGSGVSDAEKRVGVVLFAAMMLVSLVGIFQFERPVKMDFLLPLSTDTSGYFDSTLLMSWIRYAWIFVSAGALLGLVLLDGDAAVGGGKGRLRFLFLSGAFFFSSFSYLSENVLLSLMFAEIAIFLLHSFNLEMGREEAELERISYFKRNSFLFLGLLAMLGLASARVFANSSVVIMGAVLYVMAFLLSRHTFSGWRYVPLAIFQAASAFFLLSRVIYEDISPELWLPLSALFALATTIFAGLSFLSAKTLSATFWTILGLFCFLLFQRFSSIKPDDLSWGAFEAMGLLACGSLSLLHRFASPSRQAWRSTLFFLCHVLLLGIISGAIPHFNVAIAHAESRDSLMKSSVMGLLTFWVTLVAAKILVRALRQGKETDASAAFSFAILPAALVALIQLAVLLRAYDGFTGLLQFPFELFSDVSLLMRGSALLLGTLTGALLGANERLATWGANKEKRMEDLFPRIDPSVIHWNQLAAAAPERGIDWLSARAVDLNSRATSRLQDFDRKVFAEKFPGGFLAYGSSLSRLMRFLHSGNVRFYLLFGAVLTLFAGILFLLGGK